MSLRIPGVQGKGAESEFKEYAGEKQESRERGQFSVEIGIEASLSLAVRQLDLPSAFLQHPVFSPHRRPN